MKLFGQDRRVTTVFCSVFSINFFLTADIAMDYMCALQ